MKKITLLLALLMWSSNFYAQTYLDEGFEGLGTDDTVLTDWSLIGWGEKAGTDDVGMYPWMSTLYEQNNSGMTGNSGSQAAWFNELFTLGLFSEGTGDGTVENPCPCPVEKHRFLISPSMDLSGSTAPELSYFEAVRFSTLGPSAYPNIQGVYFSANYDGTINTGTEILDNIQDDVTVAAGSFVIGKTYTIKTVGDTDFVAIGAVFSFPGIEFVATGTGTGTGDATFAKAIWTAINETFGNDSELSWKYRGPFVLPAGAKVDGVVIAFQYNATEATEWFIDDVLLREPPSCVEPSAGFVTNILSTSADFDWTPGSGATATQWEVELVNLTLSETQGSGTVTTETATTKSFTSLPSSNNFELYVRADCDNAPGGDDSLWSGPYAFITAPVNNECSTAISITHENNNDSPTVTNGTINGATISLGGPYCKGTGNNDVWYSFVATEDTTIIKVDASGDFDVIVHLYLSTDDTCGTLVELPAPICSDSSGSGSGEEFTTPLVIGKTYFIRIYDFFATIPVDGDFGLSVYSDYPLSVDELEENEFTFYPNPVKDKLNLRSQNNIENVSVYNMLGQEILRMTPNSRSSEVDMSRLQTGAYFVKVTINGITETKQIIKR